MISDKSDIVILVVVCCLAATRLCGYASAGPRTVQACLQLKTVGGGGNDRNPDDAGNKETVVSMKGLHSNVFQRPVISSITELDIDYRDPEHDGNRLPCVFFPSITVGLFSLRLRILGLTL